MSARARVAVREDLTFMSLLLSPNNMQVTAPKVAHGMAQFDQASPPIWTLRATGVMIPTEAAEPRPVRLDVFW